MAKAKQHQADTGMIAFARLTKIDEAKRLVYGRATQEIPDRAGEIFDYASSKPNFETWSKSQMTASMNKSAGNVRAMHKDVGAGILTPENGIIYHDDERAIDVCAHIVDDAEWAKVQKGVYTGFSIGGRYMKKWEDPDLKKTRYTADPSEISLVDRPAVPTATFFEVTKADGSTEKRDFAKAEREETIQLVRADGAGLAVFVPASVLPKPGEEFTFEKFDYQLVKMDTAEDGTKLAVVEIVYSVTGKPEELGAFAKLLGERGITIAQATEILAKAEIKEPEAKPSDADVFARAAQMAWDAKKIDASAFGKLAKADQQPYIDEALAALTKVAERDDTSPKEGERKYGSVTFADEKNKKYPLDTEAHVRAALSYWGMAKNRAKYSAEDQKTIGGKIHAAAAKMGIGEAESKKLESSYQEQMDKAVGALAVTLAKADNVVIEGIEPADPKAAPYIEKAQKAVESAFLRKGLATCAQFAMVLNSLCQVAESIELEAAAEGDGSTIAAGIYNCIDDLGQCLQDCIAEEVKEEVEGNVGGEGQASAATLSAAQAVDDLRKRIDPIRKAYAAVNKRHVQKMHDTSVAMGAECLQKDAQNKGGVLDTAAGYRKVVDDVLAKMLPGVQLDAAKVGAALEASVASLSKVEGGEPLSKALAENAELRKSVTTLDERLKKLEAQPASVRIVTKPHAIDKAEDTGGAGGHLDKGMQRAAEIAATIQPIKKADGSIDEVATAMKITQAMGGHKVLENTPQPKG